VNFDALVLLGYLNAGGTDHLERMIPDGTTRWSCLGGNIK